MKCAQCNSENDESHKYCSSCGAPLGIICDRCKVMNELKAHYCSGCGFPFIQTLKQESDVTIPDAVQYTTGPSQYTKREVDELLTLRTKMKSAEDSAKSLQQDDINKIFG